ncbi:MAG: DNA polymerase III subunit alpha [Acholeplasmataceae bacterium]
MFGILNLQSSYSLLKSTIPMEQLIYHAKQNEYDFVACTDDQLYGLMSLFKYAKMYDIKPVLGLKLPIQEELSSTHFFIYVMNEKGYQNLLKLQLLRIEKPLELQDLKDYQEGLFFVTGGRESSLDQWIINDQLDKAFSALKTYQSFLNHLYIGLDLDSFDQEMKVAPKLYEFSERLGLKLLPTHQTSYLNSEDKETYDALLKIGGSNEEVSSDRNHQFLNKHDLISMYADYPFIFDNLSQIITKIDFDFNPPQFEMPIYPVKGGNQEEYLKSLAILGLKKRLKKIPKADEKQYQERLIYELSIIHQMGFDNYFLIVYDFVKYAKTNNILVGPGRGSAAGSLVAFCLGITDVDPITYDLLFERFLNPARISMPDIDLDFPDNRRDDVIRYVAKTYGQEHIASIITYGTFALRSSIRDIARVMKIDPQRVNGIIKRVINDDVDETDFETVRLLKVAKSIEGLPRHTGTHPAGIILSKQNLALHIPLQKGLHDFYQTQLEASEIESLGLLKIDFLGIRNLTVIDDVIKNIEKSGKKVNLNNLDFEDEKVYSLLSNAETTGIFQLESMGMRTALKKIKPRTFEDIVAILALYRPGPMDNIDTYVLRKNGHSFSYEHPDLEPILKSTYGIIIYQEQIMRIAHEFAGYTLSEADLLRRGISKKDRDYMENERLRFLDRCMSKGYSQEVSTNIYDLIVKFADYGFNRSHSVAYAMVAYQMAYLKTNFFSIFMSVLMSSVIGNEGLTLDYISEVKKQGILIESPDVNISTDLYQVIDHKIYMPILSIKGIGKSTYDKFELERSKAPFKDFLDFKRRMKKILNEKNIEMLIHAGACDGFNMNHQTMMNHKSMDDVGYESYITDFVIKDSKEYSFLELASFEKEALGYNLKYLPMNVYQEEVQKQRLNNLSVFETKTEAEVLAYIKKIKMIKTKQGKPMAFVELDDGITQLEATIFSDTYQKLLNYLTNDVQVFKMRVNDYRQEKSYIIVSIRRIDT